jgi:GNAT superfamily N-acetyltransferase
MDTQPFRLQAYDPRTASDADIAAQHAFYCRINAEVIPGEPLQTLEQFASTRRSLPPFVSDAAFSLWDAQAIVAEAYVWTLDTGDNLHLADFRLWVLPEYRRRGLARRLLGCVAGAAEERNRRLLVTQTTDTVPAGELVMARLGGRPGLAVRVSQLQVDEVDPALLAAWIERGQANAEAFELGLWDSSYPEADLAAFANLWDVMNQAPRDDLDVEDTHFTPEHLRQLDAALHARGSTRWTMYVRERATGRFAGYTEITWNPARPTWAYQQATGVFPEYRNRGLGRWLKASLLDYLRRARPEVRVVVTGNANSNAAMLKLNTELGFKHYQASTWWQVETQKVLDYVQAG